MEGNKSMRNTTAQPILGIYYLAYLQKIIHESLPN